LKKIKAAVLYEANKPLIIDEVTLEDPREGEVLVKLVATGVCHTDIAAAKSPGALLPRVLGHEGAGIISEVGKGVSALKPGDHVVLTGAGACGKCRYCLSGMPIICRVFRPARNSGALPGGGQRLKKYGQIINHFFVQSSFAEYAVVPQESAIKVADEAPLDIVCYLGCGGVTGLGSVLNALEPVVGSTLAVFGCGSVGLSSVMAAKLASVGQIIAVDIRDNRLRLARELGASHAINATREDPLEIISRLTDEGSDYSVVALSSIEVLTQAVKSLRPGGRCVTLGGVPRGTTASLDLLVRMTERSIRGGNMGSGRPSLEIPAYVSLFLEKRLPLDKLVTRKFVLEEINAAFAASLSGEVIKPVIIF